MNTKLKPKGGRDPLEDSSYVNLSDLSPKDKVWDTNKARTERGSKQLSNTALDRHSERMSTCADILTMALTTSLDTGEVNLALKQVYLCKVRECPNCNFLRARVWQKRLTEGIPLMIEANPKIRFLFLTLTMPTCPVNELRTAINLLSDSFNALTQRKAVKPFLRGYFRAIEVTKSDSLGGDAHPHLHAVLAVAPGYFSTYYLTQAKWQALWADCTGIPEPIIDIRPISVPKDSANPYASLAREVCKVAQYTSKPGKSKDDNTTKDILSDRAWFLSYSEQIAYTKAITKGGLFKQYLKDSEPTGEEILESVNDDNESNLEAVLLRFPWIKEIQRYAKRKDSVS